MNELKQLMRNGYDKLVDTGNTKVTVEDEYSMKTLDVRSLRAEEAQKSLLEIMQEASVLPSGSSNYRMHPSLKNRAENELCQMHIGLKSTLEGQVRENSPCGANAYLLGKNFVPHTDSPGYTVAVQYYKIKEE